jgi:hypothetical protein
MNIGTCIERANKNRHHVPASKNIGGIMKKLNQQGVSIFEIAIIVLTVILVLASCWYISKRIDQATHDNYQKSRIMEP